MEGAQAGSAKLQDAMIIGSYNATPDSTHTIKISVPRRADVAEEAIDETAWVLSARVGIYHGIVQSIHLEHLFSHLFIFRQLLHHHHHHHHLLVLMETIRNAPVPQKEK